MRVEGVRVCSIERRILEVSTRPTFARAFVTVTVAIRAWGSGFACVLRIQNFRDCGAGLKVSGVKVQGLGVWGRGSALW